SDRGGEPGRGPGRRAGSIRRSPRCFRPAYGGSGRAHARSAEPRAAARRWQEEEEVSGSRHFDQSSKLKNVLYEIRGKSLVEAARLEAEGHNVLKLNTGNPAIFGFDAPHQIVRDMLAALPTAHG